MKTFVYLIMGVSGSGKTTVGQALAEQLSCPFFDGDDFHSTENISKMARGLPLTDDDRQPWLDNLWELINEQLRQGQTAVLACSALKKRYRDQLRRDNDGVVFIYLRGSYDFVWRRLSKRQDHYMKATMLGSQFEDLEEPDGESALVIDIEDGEIIPAILTAISAKEFRNGNI